MNDPAVAWEAIKGTEIPQSLKKKVYATWMSHINIDAPPELLAEINKPSFLSSNGTSNNNIWSAACEAAESCRRVDFVQCLT